MQNLIDWLGIQIRTMIEEEEPVIEPVLTTAIVLWIGLILKEAQNGHND